MERRYAFVSEAVRLERLGKGWVAYHRRSGQTHFLNEAGGRMLESLGDHASTGSELRELLGLHEDLSDTTLESMLARFEEIGLLHEPGLGE